MTTVYTPSIENLITGADIPSYLGHLGWVHRDPP